jgi:hypothetical protein
MNETFKLTLLTWGTIFLMIFFLITFVLWLGTSIWWLLTNNMIDRNTFLLISTTTSLTFSLLIVIVSLFSPEK